jgi:hypothetical protein
LRQAYQDEGSFWLISRKLLERIACLFSGNLCASRIAIKALHQGKLHLIGD